MLTIYGTTYTIVPMCCKILTQSIFKILIILDLKFNDKHVCTLCIIFLIVDEKDGSLPSVSFWVGDQGTYGIVRTKVGLFNIFVILITVYDRI